MLTWDDAIMSKFHVGDNVKVINDPYLVDGIEAEIIGFSLDGIEISFGDDITNVVAPTSLVLL